MYIYSKTEKRKYFLWIYSADPNRIIYIYDVIDKKKSLVWSPRQYYAIITQSMVYFFNSSELVFEINLRTLSPRLFLMLKSDLCLYWKKVLCIHAIKKSINLKLYVKLRFLTTCTYGNLYKAWCLKTSLILLT